MTKFSDILKIVNDIHQREIDEFIERIEKEWEGNNEGL